MEHFSFWPFLRELIDLHSLEALKEKLNTHQRTVGTVPNSLKSQVGRIDTEKEEVVSSPLESVHRLQSSQSERSTESLANGLQYELVVASSPPVVSGACQLLQNILLSFPEQIGTSLHKSGFVISLARCVYVCTVGILIIRADF